MIFREIEDRDLILSARKGDVQAYNILVARWEKKVYNYFLRSLGNREDSLDLCQETFLKAYRGLTSLVAIDRFPQWLFRIAHNELISMRRKALPQPFGDALERSADSASLLRSRLGRLGYAGTELGLVLEQALAALPSRQREVVLLKVYHGFKFEEIAEILGCPASTAKSRLYVALDALREVLEPVSA